MKKYIIVLLLLTTVACNTTINTPTSRVKEYLSKYQNLDEEVLKELDKTIEKDETMTSKQKEQYISIIEKQYQNLAYKIKNETINDNNAFVDVEIEVLNYHSTISSAREYYIEHQEEFENDNNKNYIDYKIEKLKKVNDKAKYTITFNLKREKNIWYLEELNEDDLKKIHGLY